MLENKLHALSIDVEDWFQGLDLPHEHWSGFERRIDRSMRDLLDFMDEAGVRATCFILGAVAAEHPQLVMEIAARGHEVGTHGFWHERVYRLSPAQFRQDLSNSIERLEDLTGRRVMGYRAPFFTIRRSTMWALEIVCELGMRYDSSILPAWHYRTGIPEARRAPYHIDFGRGNTLLELPVSTVRVLGLNVPVGGGGYYRLLPAWLSHALFASLARSGERIRFYLHPWELDPDHPRVTGLPPLLAFTHYHRLSSTRRRLIEMFRRFQFAPYAEVYSYQVAVKAA